MKMKKVTAILLALAMTVSTAACGGGQGANQKEGGSDALAETSKDTSADTTEQARENQEADAGESAETDLSDAPTSLWMRHGGPTTNGREPCRRNFQRGLA